MKFHIRNMKNAECEARLINLCKAAGIKLESVHAGEVSISHTDMTTRTLKLLKEKTEEAGFDLITSRKEIIAEQIKHIVYFMISEQCMLNQNYSKYIAEKMHLSYTYLANVFSEVEGITIEHFIIDRKIDRVKHLLTVTDYSIGKIAADLRYSSIAHLSNQFKKVTGLTPSGFKRTLKPQTATC